MATERMEGTTVDELAEDAAEVLIVEPKENHRVWMVEESGSDTM
jgi:hypothetical protein